MNNLRHLASVIASLLLISLPVVSAQTGVEAAIAAYRDRDFTTAFAGFEPLARAGDARSQTILAIMYRYGEGVSQDTDKARDWYLRAAKQGYGPAQYYLADMLLGGNDIPADEAAGMAWMEKAAAGGYDRAIAYLAGHGPVDAGREAPEWSRDWDLRLPNHIRFSPGVPQPAYRALLATGISQQAVEQSWLQIRRRHPGPLADTTPDFHRNLLSGDDRFQLQVGRFETEADARQFCESLEPTPCDIVYR